MKAAAAHRQYQEAGNWLSSGRGDVISALLDRYRRRRGAVLEIGSGSGAHLPLLARFGCVDAIEPHDEGWGLLTQRPELRTLYRGAVPELKIATRYDLIGAFDVIEHIRDEDLAMSWVVEHLVDGGLFVVTVPAYQWLFSAHDVANEHYRRYTRRSLVDALPPELRVLRCGYFNTILFPLAVSARATWSLTNRLARRHDSTITDKQPSRAPDILDRVFRRVLLGEADLIKAGVTPPFGLSVFCVAQKARSRVAATGSRRPSQLLWQLERTPVHTIEQDGSVEISAVVPLYNEQESVRQLVQRLVGSLDALGRSYEIVLVDDGSTDGTAAALLKAQSEYERVRGIFLVRNYGQSTAMQAGFDHCRGDIVVTLDGDLQNDPDDIRRMLELMNDTGADLVSGWRRDRRDGTLRVWASQVANRLIARITRIPLHDFGCTLKVYRAAILKQVRIYGEMHRYLPAVLAEVGARTVEIQVGHHPRKYGRSKYGFDRTVRVLLDLLLIRFLQRYVHRPLHLFGGFGLALLAAGGSISAYLSFRKIFLGEDIGGRPLLLLGVVLMLSGITLLGQGLLGELLIRVLHEPRGRRKYIARRPAASTSLQDQPEPVTPGEKGEKSVEIVTLPRTLQEK